MMRKSILCLSIIDRYLIGLCSRRLWQLGGGWTAAEFWRTYGVTHEQLAMVSVVQREWAAKNPRATFKTPIPVEDVLNSRMIAYPFRLLQCCLVTDGGRAS